MSPPAVVEAAPGGKLANAFWHASGLLHFIPVALNH